MTAPKQKHHAGSDASQRDIHAKIASLKDERKHMQKEITELIEPTVDEIIQSEDQGNQQAFADWHHDLYITGLGGEWLANSSYLLKSPLALDMIADWKHECDDRAERIKLVDHILSHYTAEDFDEPEHYNAQGQPILPCGEPDEAHYDKGGNPVTPYVPSWERDSNSE